MKKPLILVTNDDGITAPGLRTLIHVMNKIGEVVVVAPDSPQSAKSNALTLDKPIRCNSIKTFMSGCIPNSNFCCFFIIENNHF